MSRLNEALKGVKKYRAKAKEVKKKIKGADYRKEDGSYDWDQWKFDLKEGAREIREERKRIVEEQKQLSEKEREQRSKAFKLWVNVIYWILNVAIKFLPVGAPVQLILSVINLLKFYKRF